MTVLPDCLRFNQASLRHAETAPRPVYCLWGADVLAVSLDLTAAMRKGYNLSQGGLYALYDPSDTSVEQRYLEPGPLAVNLVHCLNAVSQNRHDF